MNFAPLHFVVERFAGVGTRWPTHTPAACYDTAAEAWKHATKDRYVLAYGPQSCPIHNPPAPKPEVKVATW